MIESQAQNNIRQRFKETNNRLDTQHNSPHDKGRFSSPPLPPLPVSAYSRSPKPEYNSTNEYQTGINLESLILSGNFTLKVIGLRKDNDHPPLSTLELQLRGDATLDDIKVAIKDAGSSLMTILPMFSLPSLRRRL